MNNYKQALDVIDTHSAILSASKIELGITSDSTFTTWLDEECAYLKALRQAPEGEDVLKMEYLTLLKKLEPVE